MTKLRKRDWKKDNKKKRKHTKIHFDRKKK